jgi:hypothetical protein
LADTISNPIAEENPLSPEKDVYRGLQPDTFYAGNPTETSFIMRKNHTTEKSLSHLVCDFIPRAEAERFLSAPKWVLVRLNVGEMLNPPGQASLADRGLRLIPFPDNFFQEYAHAHAVLTGYQMLTNKEIGEYARYLALLAKKALNA